LALSADTEYAIIITTSNQTTDKWIQWAIEAVGTYAGGAEGWFDGSVWADSSSDAYFIEAGNLAPFSYTLTVQVGLTASLSRATTYGRSLTVEAGVQAFLESELNQYLFLCVASQDQGSVKTADPVGGTWTACAKDATGSLAGAWLAQFNNRLCVLRKQYAGFSYSPVGDIVSDWTDKPAFPNYPGAFTGMFAGRDSSDNPTLYFLSPTGMHYLDVFTNFVYGKTELTWEEDNTAGKKGIYFRGAHYIAVGKGVYQLQAGVAAPVGPDTDDGLPEDLQGTVSDMIGVGFWLVIAVDGGEGAKSSILKRYITGKHWHVVYTGSVNTPIRALVWDSGTLYFGEGTNVKSLPFSNLTDNAKLLATHTYGASGTLYYPRFHSEFEAMPKVAHKVRAVTRGCSSDETITVSYRIDSNTAWTELGSFTSSPRPTALSFSDAGVEFESIEFKAVSARGGTTTNGPKVESLTLEFRVIPPLLWGWDMKIVARTDRDHTGQAIINALATVAEATTLLSFYPSGSKDGTEYFVEVVGHPRNEEGTEFGQEGTYGLSVQQVT